MEIHQLRYAAALARTGNFSRAAGQCHVSQPSLSQQIQKLEAELGERLFERQRHRTRLTVFGERFVLRAERVLHELEEARREARESHALAHGEVVVGVLPTIAPYFAPGAAAVFSGKFPGITVTIVEETTEVLLGLMRRQEIDFAVASLPIPDERMEVRPLLTEELFLVLPDSHRLARKRRLSAEDLGDEPFVLMKEGHCLGDQVLRFCDRNNIQPRVRSRSSQIETMLALVEAGQGICLVPEMAKSRARAKVVFRSLTASRPERVVVAFWQKRRPMNRAASEFLETLAFQARKMKKTAPI